MAVQAEKIRYRYADYRQWDGPERWELIDGEPWLMSPAPTSRHQRLVGEVYFQFASFLRGKKCEALVSPIDVRLPAGAEAEDDIETVVQPDVVVVCDRSKVVSAGILGAPDLVVEVLSASTSKRDREVKRDLYLKRGVREYWVVNGESQEIAIHAPAATPRLLRQGDPVNSRVLPGFELDWGALSST